MRKKSKAAAKKAVLEALPEVLEYGAAAKRAGVTRKTVYTWRMEDPEFAEACEHARGLAIDELVRSTYEQALNRGGKHDERTSALLKMFLIKGNRPEYKDSYRPEVAVKEIRFTMEIPKPEGLKQLPEHVIDGEVVGES